MPVTKDVIAHILKHVNAEAGDSDPSQVAGVARRAQYVRDAVASFKADTRDLTIDMLLAEISTAASLSADSESFKRTIQNHRDRSGYKPWIPIGEWVSKELEDDTPIDEVRSLNG